MLIARYQRAGGIHFGSLEGDVLKRLSGDLFGKLTPTDQIDLCVASLVGELEEARLLALKLGQASAAVQCSMGKAKLLGLIIDRREVGNVGAFDHMTDEELMREIEKKSRELGLDVQPSNKAH